MQGIFNHPLGLIGVSNGVLKFRDVWAGVPLYIARNLDWTRVAQGPLLVPGGGGVALVTFKTPHRGIG
jgi:hypothetical protein